MFTCIQASELKSCCYRVSIEYIFFFFAAQGTTSLLLMVRVSPVGVSFEFGSNVSSIQFICSLANSQTTTYRGTYGKTGHVWASKHQHYHNKMTDPRLVSAHKPAGEPESRHQPNTVMSIFSWWHHPECWGSLHKAASWGSVILHQESFRWISLGWGQCFIIRWWVFVTDKDLHYFCC